MKKKGSGFLRIIVNLFLMLIMAYCLSMTLYCMFIANLNLFVGIYFIGNLASSGLAIVLLAHDLKRREKKK